MKIWIELDNLPLLSFFHFCVFSPIFGRLKFGSQKNQGQNHPSTKNDLARIILIVQGTVKASIHHFYMPFPHIEAIFDHF